MKRALLAVVALVMLTGAAEPFDANAVDKTARATYDDGKYAFCTNPNRPLMGRQKNLCSIAKEVDGCEGFQKACADITQPKDKDGEWLRLLADFLGPLAQILLYLLILVIIVVIAIPIIGALRKLRRNQKLATADEKKANRAEIIEVKPILPDIITDAEAALRLADEHHARGELDRAMGLYLAASLAALDHRGAIRVARHRTNGEYVRACEEAASRPPLREIVREVDKVEFGGASPTNDSVMHVASRAKTIVRRVVATTATMAMIALFGVGCSGAPHGSDPAGDEVPIEVLKRNGFTIAALGKSLATMPIPEPAESDVEELTAAASKSAMPVVIVDVEHVPLEDEALAHMMRWVEAGGVLVLFGHVHSWPKELALKAETASTRVLSVRTRDYEQLARDAEETDNDNDDGPRSVDRSLIEIKDAHVARDDAFSVASTSSTHTEAIGGDWDTLATLGTRTYAAKKRLGKGIVLGVANDDLFTNVGVLRPHNAAALVAIVRSASQDPRRKLPFMGDRAKLSSEVRVARAEDGIPPPSNPFAALVAAGLGKGAWHALAAAALLFLAVGIRHARARTASQKTRRAFAEHVEATGAFYGRTRSHGHALHAYGRFVEMRLREIIPRGSDPIHFLASRSGTPIEEVTALYTRAIQAKTGDTTRGDELGVIEDLRRLMEKAASSKQGF